MTRTALTQLSECKRCDVGLAGGIPILPAGNGETAKLILIASRTNDEDHLLSDHLMNPAGHQVRAALVEAGWSLSEVYFTSTIKCSTKAAIRTGCFRICVVEWLINELEANPSTPVVCLGRPVGELLLKHGCASVLYRPMYVIESESSLLMGGRRAWLQWVQFFKGIRSGITK